MKHKHLHDHNYAAKPPSEPMEIDEQPSTSREHDQSSTSRQFVEQPGTSRQVEYPHTDHPSTSRVSDPSQFYELGQPEEMHL